MMCPASGTPRVNCARRMLSPLVLPLSEAVEMGTSNCSPKMQVYAALSAYITHCLGQFITHCLGQF